LVFDNAIMFNEPGTVVSDLANKLQKVCVKGLNIVENKIKLDSVAETEERKDEGEKGGKTVKDLSSPSARKDGSSETSLIIRRTPKSLKKRRIVIHGVTEKTPKSTSKETKTKKRQVKKMPPTAVPVKDLGSFLDQLMEEDKGLFFHALIDPEQMPMYYEVIKKPICLLDIKDNIDPNEAVYPTVHEFEVS
jgi:hypothetical protein